MRKQANKGFTLIELLVVIAIIAVLSVVVILTLNPAELLRQARDSNRISDLATLKSAISLYLADVSPPYLGTSTSCYVDTTSGNSTTTNCTWFAQGPATTAFCYQNGNTTANACTATTNPGPAPRKVDGTGWIPINFGAISSGAPIGQLPVDPLDNDGKHFYSYHASSTSLTFKLAAKMESSKYSASGTSDVESTDGGTVAYMYEQGTNLTGL